MTSSGDHVDLPSVVAALRQVLTDVDSGVLTAHTGLVRRLEGAALALDLAGGTVTSKAPERQAVGEV